MKKKSSFVTVAVLAGFATNALAQDGAAPAPAAPSGGDDSGQPGSVTVVQVPGATTQQTTVVSPGYPAPGTNLEGHLPSSSHAISDTSRSSDGFDLVPKSGAGGSVRGAAGGSYVVEGQFVPDAHSVRRGDTLWDISGRYYQNPYNWPRLWAYNPQIQNPHWIYPGDRVLLREGGAGDGPGSGFGLRGRRSSIPTGTVFLRDVGWVDDPDQQKWGEIVGAPDDQMLLGEGDDIYVQLEDNQRVQLGQELTVWQPLEAWRSDGGSGKLVSIRGTARIERYNPKTGMVRAKLIESLDVIERGAAIGPVGRRFDVVPPVPNDLDIEARILASVYPYQLFGQDQVVFIDKGEKDGVRPGNRFFAVRRGDRWYEQQDTIGQMGLLRPRVEDPRPAKVDDMKDEDDAEKYPDETYAELRVIRVKAHTATAIVTASTYELERNARLIARKGY